MGEDTWAHAMCHLVAHSKGGSDCRYLVTKALQEYNDIKSNKHFNVLGLFSLDTPFRGTPVSDLSCAITNSKLSLGMFNGGASPEVVQSISSATTAVSLAVSFGSTPHEPDPIPGKTTRRGSCGAPSSSRTAKQARLFYAPAMAAFRKERLSFGSDRFCKTENNF
jgi:hypothetical protein